MKGVVAITCKESLGENKKEQIIYNALAILDVKKKIAFLGRHSFHELGITKKYKMTFGISSFKEQSWSHKSRNSHFKLKSFSYFVCFLIFPTQDIS